MELRPKFRADCTVHRQNDGESAERIVLNDPVSGKFYRLSEYEFRLLSALDGAVTVDEAAEKLKAAGHYYAPTDARQIVAKASQLGLLLGTGYSTALHLQTIKSKLKSVKRTRLLSNVYYLFIPIWDPDRFLNRTVWVFRLVATRRTALFGTLAALGAIYLIVAGLPRINLEYLFFFNWENLLYLWGTVALTKLVHEFAHAYTAKHFGLRVPEMGVAFLIFFPCLYCNTTDAWQLADRRQRAAIAAAGIVAEGVLAVIATYVWFFSRPGLLNSLAFYQMAVSFGSTVLFNGNPLLKFDGYFILIDVLGLPNLAGNSLKHVKYLFMNRVMGNEQFSTPAQNPGQAQIFAVYGICALCYRMTLYTAIVVGVYHRFDKVIGIALAILALGLFVVRPMWGGIRTLYSSRQGLSPRPRGVVVLAIVTALLAGLVFVPHSSTSVYPCFVGSEKVQKLTVPLQTLVKKVYVQEGSVVNKGDLLFQLDTSAIMLKLRQKQWEQKAIAKEILMLLLDQKLRSKAEGKEVELRHVEDEILMLEERLRMAESSIIAPFDGVVTKIDPRVQEGFQPGEGMVVGEMQSATDIVVHALVPSSDIVQVRENQAVVIWLPVGTGKILNRKVDSVKSYSEKDLRNSPFSSRVGGELATEMRGENREDAPLEPQYDCSVRLTDVDRSIPLGMTGRMAVLSPPRSLAARVVDGVIRTFNRESLL
ncbi:MAG: HlyD family efflux transporter periplasmic adaptor subunit [Desulfomonile tiedjei]|nr:HlyD family efflux transporter periplasmic adaptor subunit [Desulfomonile tiedjei]